MDILCCCFHRQPKEWTAEPKEWTAESQEWTSDACVSFLKEMTAEASDDLHSAVVAHFVRCPPENADMAQLSMLQQSFEGSMGIEDYACTTVFLCAQEAILNITEHRPQTLQSISSFAKLCDEIEKKK